MRYVDLIWMKKNKFIKNKYPIILKTFKYLGIEASDINTAIFIYEKMHMT